MIKKLVEIEDCEDCPHVWMYLGLDEHCTLKNRKPCNLKDYGGFPEWCPLPNAKPEVVCSKTEPTT